jgi:hypothetical protein
MRKDGRTDVRNEAKRQPSRLRESRKQAIDFRLVSFKEDKLGAQFFLTYLLFFSTCFGQICAHH